MGESNIGFEIASRLFDDPQQFADLEEVDLNLSNVGRWPFPDTTFLGLGQLTATFTGQTAALGAKATDMVLFTACVG